MLPELQLKSLGRALVSDHRYFHLEPLILVETVSDKETMASGQKGGFVCAFRLLLLLLQLLVHVLTKKKLK